MNTGYVTRRLAVATLLVAALSGIVAAHVEPGLASITTTPQAPAMSPAYRGLPQLPEVVVTASRTGA
jgi:hypothetical protein